MNKIELANEVFVLITGYFMLLFTDYAAPNVRYEVVRVYSYVLTSFIGFNLACIFIKVVIDLIKECKL